MLRNRPNPRARRCMVGVALVPLLTLGCGTHSLSDADSAIEFAPDESPAQSAGPDDRQRGERRDEEQVSPFMQETASGHPSEAAGEVARRPEWLGTRVLAARQDGIGHAQPTPPELRDRRLPPPAGQPRATSSSFAATIEHVPPDVVDRSTWHPGCPVDLGELRYVTVTFWGFDSLAYVGELLVHHVVAEDVVSVFERLYADRFPIEEMRIVTTDELDAPPTGDGNNTTAFVCRPTVQGQRWSEHAFGLAVDINPFHNPYVRGDVVIPELAEAYGDRDKVRAGMIVDGDVATEAFVAIGWGWGGHWRSASDPMHFSQNGR